MMFMALVIGNGIGIYINFGIVLNVDYYIILKEVKMKCHKCPICHGLGQLQYWSISAVFITDGIYQLIPYKCKYCDGTGLIWRVEKEDLGINNGGKGF